MNTRPKLQAPLRTWGVPTRPRGVFGVTDGEGDLWRLCSRKDGGRFECEGEIVSWHTLICMYGPVTEVRYGRS